MNERAQLHTIVTPYSTFTFGITLEAMNKKGPQMEAFSITNID